MRGTGGPGSMFRSSVRARHVRLGRLNVPAGVSLVVSWLVSWLLAGAPGCTLDTSPISAKTERELPVAQAPMPPVPADAQAREPSDAARDACAQSIGDDGAVCDKGCRTDEDCPAATHTCRDVMCVSGHCVQQPRAAGSTCDDDAGLCSMDGVCRACEPGQSMCTSERERRSCDASGHWSAPLRCEAVCVAGRCAQCRPGTAECSGHQLRVCTKAGQWAEPKDCERGCSAGACQACSAGAARCSADGTQLQTCSAQGQWMPFQACELGCAADRCKTCTPGSSRCGAGQQQTCGADGQWSAAAQPCSFGCAGDRCGACAPGTRECVGDRLGELRVCGADATWQPAVACPLGCVAGVCNECRAGEQRCSEAGVQVCSPELHWQTQLACPYGCSGNTCAACAEGSVECTSRTTLRSCRNGTWGQSDACRPNSTCNATPSDGNVCPCDPGYTDPHPSPGLCMPL